jgi:hypothetical protein
MGQMSRFLFWQAQDFLFSPPHPGCFRNPPSLLLNGRWVKVAREKDRYSTLVLIMKLYLHTPIHHYYVVLDYFIICDNHALGVEGN